MKKFLDLCFSMMTKAVGNVRETQRHFLCPPMGTELDKTMAQEAMAGAHKRRAGRMVKGKVKWFNNQKGYGFLVPDNTNDDVFVHYSTIQGEGYKTLTAGQDVEFEVIKSEKGAQAQNVLKVK